MLRKMSLTSYAPFLALVILFRLCPVVGAEDRIQKGEMAGYLLVPHEKVPETHNAGFSL